MLQTTVCLVFGEVSACVFKVFDALLYFLPRSYQRQFQTRDPECSGVSQTGHRVLPPFLWSKMCSFHMGEDTWLHTGEPSGVQRQAQSFVSSRYQDSELLLREQVGAKGLGGADNSLTWWTGLRAGMLAERRMKKDSDKSVPLVTVKVNSGDGEKKWGIGNNW